MLHKNFSCVVAFLFLSIATLKTQANPTTTFHCLPVTEGNQKNFGTVARRGKRQTSAIIIWRSEVAGIDPQERCNIVSQRLNSAVSRSNGNLSQLLLTYGKVNGETVICYLDKDADNCNSKNTLFTLSPQNRNKGPEILHKMIAFGQRGSGSGIYESSGSQSVIFIGEEIEKMLDSQQ
jgi:hypothetical protein